MEPGSDEPSGVWGKDVQGDDPVGGLVRVEPVRGIGEEEGYPPGPFQFFPWADPRGHPVPNLKDAKYI